MLRQNPQTLDQQKLSLLRKNFNHIPFSPSKTLDFSSHEKLFRALNLWEFVNLDILSEIRSDLLIPFIANYDPWNRRSFVRNVEISVTRSELARSLKLEEDNGETHKDEFLKDESKEVILEFMSKYILIEDEDDMCILPEDAMVATKMVREGRANEVDWVGLIWVLIEMEILGARRSGSCRFASHVQYLMKCQQPGLFEEAGTEGTVVVLEPESSMEVSDSEDEEGDDRDGVGVENGDLMDGIEHCKGDDKRNWFDEDKDLGFEHCLRRCNSDKARGLGFESLCKGDEFSILQRLISTDLHALDAVRVSYSPRINSLDEDTEHLLSVSVYKSKNDSLFYENNGKRHIESIDIDADDVGCLHHNGRQKRTRCGGIWQDQASSRFDSCMEQIQCTMVKAKMLYAEKEQACLNAHLQIQCLNEMLKQKGQIIRTLEKTRVEERERWQNAVYQYEHELNVLANIVFGYKRALKKTQNEFDEYRKKCPQGEKPFYMEVGGGGGLVLTSREVEKLQLEKEEEMRRTAEEMINAFQCDWVVKFEGYTELVMKLQRRLIELDGKVQLVTENFLQI